MGRAVDDGEGIEPGSEGGSRLETWVSLTRRPVDGLIDDRGQKERDFSPVSTGFSARLPTRKTIFPRSHAPRGNAVLDALRPSGVPRRSDDAERRGRHSHGGPWER